MTDPVVIHLKDLNGWDIIVLKLVVKGKIGAEGNQLLI